MKVKTPILLIVFNRPEKTKMILDSIKRISPKTIYVSADGPRANNLEDVQLCKEVRNIINNISWNCDVKTRFMENNLSCKKNVIQSINWFFENNEKGIILEDDCLPSESFFTFCEQILEKYNFEEKIMQINGFNGGLKFQDTNNASYFFSKLNTTWGWATWKRAWKKFDENFQNYSEIIKNKKITEYYENQEIADWMERYFIKSIKKQDNIWSTNWSYTILKNDGLCVSPLNNLVKNIGFDISATSGKTKKFSKYSMSVDNNFQLDKFASKIIYNKYNDERYFYDLIKGIDPRAKKENIIEKIKNYFLN